eukprot:1122570-Prymnesium_polylepis.1
MVAPGGTPTEGNTTPTSCSASCIRVSLRPTSQPSCTSSRSDESRYTVPVDSCSSALSSRPVTLNTS